MLPVERRVGVRVHAVHAAAHVIGRVSEILLLLLLRSVLTRAL